MNISTNDGTALNFTMSCKMQAWSVTKCLNFSTDLANDGEGAHPLAVEPHVLGVRLGEADVVAVGDELADGEGVLVHVAGGEALVGHVEEGVEVLLLDHLAHLAPLLGLGVDPGRVVGAGVEHDDALVGDVGDVLHRAVEVEAAGGGVIVPETRENSLGVLFQTWVY